MSQLSGVPRDSDPTVDELEEGMGSGTRSASPLTSDGRVLNETPSKSAPGTAIDEVRNPIRPLFSSSTGSRHPPTSQEQVDTSTGLAPSSAAANMHSGNPLLSPLPVENRNGTNATSSTSASSSASKDVISSTSRGSRLGARKISMSEKAKGKQPVRSLADQVDPSTPKRTNSGSSRFDEITEDGEAKRTKGRHVGIRFTGYPSGAVNGTQGKGRDEASAGDGEEVDSGKDLDLWIEEGETIGMVKDKIRTLRPILTAHSLRVIHSGRILTDGIQLISWLEALERRTRAQAQLSSVVQDVLDAAGGTGSPSTDLGSSSSSQQEKTWLHCVVGPKMEEKVVADKDVVPEVAEETSTTPASGRRGFDTLLDAGFSQADVAQMRRQFYASRGIEPPEDLGGDDEHARALEEQWIEGDMTNETAAVVSEGEFTAALRGLLVGFFFPLIAFAHYLDPPHPTWFDPLRAESKATRTAGVGGDGSNQTTSLGIAYNRTPSSSSTLGVTENATDENGQTSTNTDAFFQLRGRPGGDWATSVVFSPRVQVAILVGTVMNLVFGGLRLMAT